MAVAAIMFMFMLGIMNMLVLVHLTIMLMSMGVLIGIMATHGLSPPLSIVYSKSSFRV